MAVLHFDRPHPRRIAPSELPASQSSFHFSLTYGGPFHRLTVALGLVRDEAADVVRLSLAALAVCWLPLALLGTVDAAWAGRRAELVRDLTVEARLWVALPLLFLASRWVHVTTRDCIDQFLNDGLAGEDSPAAKRLFARVMQLRDAWLPELVLLALALGIGFAALLRTGRPDALLKRAAIPTAESIAWAWFALVALPFQLFLTLRAVWRWVLWTVMLVRLSRLRLRPDATHPDGRGGLERFSEPSVAFAPVLSGIAAVTAAQWARELLSRQGTVEPLKPYLALFVIAALIVTLAPLTAFSWHLRGARRRALADYTGLNVDYARAFRQRWVGPHGQRPELLGTADIQSMADLANVFATVKRTRYVPVDLRRALGIVAITLAPMLPLALTQMSLIELTSRVLKLLAGGRD
jgi:hypothetical protein